jgi:hypothetical protein
MLYGQLYLTPIHSIGSSVLFATIATSHNPFQSHLLGTTRDPDPESAVNPVQSAYTYPPMPPGYEKRTPSHSHSNSVTSVSSQDSLPATIAIPSRPLSPTDRIVPVDLGRSTPDLSAEHPQTADHMRTRSGTATPNPSPPRSPPKARMSTARAASAYGALSRTSAHQSTTSLTTLSYQTSSSNLFAQPTHPFASHPRLNDSVNMLPGFTPLAPIIRPTPSLLSESAFKAIHPPAQAFRHVSSPYSPVARPGTAGGLSTPRTMSTEPQLGLGGRRTPSVHSGGYAYQHHRGHSRSHSAGIIPLMTPANASPTLPTRHSSRSSSSGSASLPRSGLNQMRTVNDPDAIEVIAPTVRTEDMDMAIRLERKLAEVQARLERNEGRSTTDASSYSGESYGSVEHVAPLHVIKKSSSAVDLGRDRESETEAFSKSFLLGEKTKNVFGGGFFGGNRGAPGG